MLKSLFLAASLFTAASAGAAEPVVTTNEVVIAEDPLFDIDLNAELPCDRDPGHLCCKDTEGGKPIE